MTDYVLSFTWHEVLAQAVGFAAFAAFMLAYQIKDTRKTQIAFIPGNVLYGLQYYLLGSTPAAVILFAAALRDLAGARASERGVRILIVAYLVFLWGFSAAANDHWQEYAVALSGTISTLAILLRDNFYRFRAALLGRQAAILGFNIWINSLGGVIHLVFTMASNCVGIYRHTTGSKGRRARPPRPRRRNGAQSPLPPPVLPSIVIKNRRIAKHDLHGNMP